MPITMTHLKVQVNRKLSLKIVSYRSHVNFCTDVQYLTTSFN